MEALIVVLVLVALAGGVFWNHRNAAAARSGVEFPVAAPARVVADALRAAYCGGVRASAVSLFSGVSVTQSGPDTFDIGSRLGDSGRIEVHTTGAGTVVRAFADDLYIGSHPSSHFRGGALAFGAVITHGLFTMLGIAPGAAKIRRLQAGIESRVTRELQRAGRA